MTDPDLPDRYPYLNGRRFICPHCDAFSQQQWTILVVPDSEGVWEYLEYEERYPSGVSRWNGARCGSCDRWSIWRDGAMVYPQTRVGSPPHPEMPESARTLYKEAAAVAHVSRRAGAAMARAALERLINEIDSDAPARSNLESRIGRIRPRVSTHLGKLLDVVRVTGNNALHQNEAADQIVVLALDDQEGPQILSLLLEAANDLVEELITRPRVADELWGKLPETIRDRLSSQANGSPSD